MKLLSLIFIAAAALCSGCNNTASIKRTPPQRKTVKKYPQPQRKSRSDDPLFDAVFKHKPQQNDTFSNLSEKEKQLIRQYDVRNDHAVQDFHDRNRKSQADRDKWVYGTGIRQSKKSGRGH